MSENNYAGFWIRFVAWLIDWIILGFVNSVIVMPILGMIGIGAASMDYSAMNEEDAVAMISMLSGAMGALQIVTLIAGWLYFALMESSAKQATIGKMALGLKVTTTDGQKLDFAKATIRYIGKLISGIILLIGYIMAAFTEKKQALHDIIAGTLVLKK